MTGAFSLAVHALVYLDHKGTYLSSEALAGNICTNPARVRKVMALLKRAELVTTREGAQGGYSFSGDPSSVTLAQVARSLDARFVEAGWHSGDEDMECLVASGMARIMDTLYDALNAQCLERLEHITLGDVEEKIFGKPVPPPAE